MEDSKCIKFLRQDWKSIVFCKNNIREVSGSHPKTFENTKCLHKTFDKYRICTQKYSKSIWSSPRTFEKLLNFYANIRKKPYLHQNTRKVFEFWTKIFKRHHIRSLIIWKVLDFSSKQLKGIGFLRNMFEKFRIFTKKPS